MSTPDRGHSPIAGENRLAVTALAVMLGISLLGFLAAAIATWAGSSLRPTLWVTGILVIVSGVGLVSSIAQRRAYLRRVRNGDVIERQPWSGADTLPPG